jgi:GDP-L-fucose synthase
MKKNSTILVTGSSGMVGSQLVKKMKELGYKNLLTPTSKELNLKNQALTSFYFLQKKPEYVFHLAAKVGGIQANIDNPVSFLEDNLLININLFKFCYLHNVKKVLYLGSSCIYPKECKQPMKEEYLLSGKLEDTNEGYALAKIIGLKLAKYYYQEFGLKTVCLMPSNIYGTNDNYNIKKSHVMAALIKKFVDARDENKKTVTLWGDGSSRREFIHVDDIVNAILYMFKKVNNPEIINIGTGVDCTIKDLANVVAYYCNYKGKIIWDKTKPNGMRQKLLDISKMKELGFKSKNGMLEKISKTIKEYEKMKVGEK